MSKARILLADDSPTILEMVKFILSMGDYEVVTASDGLEAVERVYETSPDMVILDIMMPHMNGYQACRLLKNDPLTKHIPVMILTSKDQASDKFWGLQTGADEFITKDFKPPQLLEAVGRVLERGSVGKLALPPVERPRSSMDIFAKINDLMDKKLYEATILNEIGKVGHNISDFEETVKSVMVLLSKLIDYTVAAVAFSSDRGTEVLINLNYPVEPQLIDEFKVQVLGAMQSYGMDTTPEDAVARVFHAEGESKASDKGINVRSFLATPISVGNQIKGSFAVGALASSWFTEEDAEILEIISNQAYVVIENARLYREISRISVTDGLTGIYNRRYLMDALEREFSRASRHKEAFSLIMVDIDHFKKVNDTYGHQTGDVVLKETARILNDALRKSDTIGRYGGEEFCIILPETTLEGARAVAENLRALVEAHVFHSGDTSLRATASLGVSSFPVEGITSSADLLKRADEALYRAKEGGRNRVCVREASS